MWRDHGYELNSELRVTGTPVSAAGLRRHGADCQATTLASTRCVAGPNEAAEGVRSLVLSHARKVLNNADVVIIVVDFTSMGTVQESDLLEWVQSLLVLLQWS